MNDQPRLFSLKYDIPVWQMARDAAEGLPEVFTPADIIRKIREKRPHVNAGTIRASVIGCSPNHPSRKYYSIPHDFFYYFGDARFRLLKEGEESPKPPVPNASDEEVEKNEFTFQFEDDLEEHLARRLSDVEEGLRLDKRQYKTAAGKMKIDLLARDKDNNFVVIEVKAGQASDASLGQLLGYMEWFKKHEAGDKKVRGIIVCWNATDRLKYAVLSLENVKIKEYEIQFTFSDADIEMD